METKNPGDKTLSVAPKKATLGLKRGVERDTVRQSFSHGRTNTVQVERKKRRIVLPGEGRAEQGPSGRTHEPAMAGPERAHSHESRPAPSPRAGLVLRQLSDDEIDARARALADAKAHEAEERKAAEEAAVRRAAESARLQREREEAERRKTEEEARRKAEETARERAEQEARRRFGGEETKPAAAEPDAAKAAARPGLKLLKDADTEEEERPASLRGRVKAP